MARGRCRIAGGWTENAARTTFLGGSSREAGLTRLGASAPWQSLMTSRAGRSRRRALPTAGPGGTPRPCPRFRDREVPGPEGPSPSQPAESRTVLMSTGGGESAVCGSKRGVSGRGYRAAPAPGSSSVPTSRTLYHINDHRMTRNCPPRSPVSSAGPGGHCGGAREGTGTFRPKAPTGEPGRAAPRPTLPANSWESPSGARNQQKPHGAAAR